MKKSLLYLSLFLSIISCTNYYTVLLQEDTPLYPDNKSETSVTVIPKGTEVYISSKSSKKNYRKLTWGSYSGWANNPSYLASSNYTKTSYSSPKVSSSSNYNSSSVSHSVHVNGYTRKNGTYVRPHTRSAPRRR